MGNWDAVYALASEHGAGNAVPAFEEAAAEWQSQGCQFGVAVVLIGLADPPVVIPTGSVYQQPTMGMTVQNLATSRSVTAMVPAGATVPIVLPAYCLNHSFSPPNGPVVPTSLIYTAASGSQRGGVGGNRRWLSTGAMTGGLPTPVDAAIDAHIGLATAAGLAAIATPGRPAAECSYVIKFTGAQYGGKYPPSPNAAASPGLFVSPSPGFTWGPGTYVCPVAYPISGAIYGRCGIVAALPDTSAWRIFNATNPVVAGLYVQWVQHQPLFSMLTLTAHANWANHLLRGLFKTRFRIDVVVFPPDEFHSEYTDRANDRWLAVSEWTPAGTLTSGVVAAWPINPRLTIILAEEFQLKQSGIRRKALIGPTPALPHMKPTASDVTNAYHANNLLWVGA